MKIGSKEFYDMMDNFENNKNNLPYTGSFEREDKSMWVRGQIYQDGKTNSFFQCFMLGYQLGRLTYM